MKRVKERRDEGGFSPGNKCALAVKQVVSDLLFGKGPHTRCCWLAYGPVAEK